MKWEQLHRTVRALNDHLNLGTLTWVHQKRIFLLAIGCFALAVWGVFSNHFTFTFGLVVIGGIGYFTGIFAALVASTILLLSNLVWISHTTFSIAIALLELVGYAVISWLGQSHRQIKKLHSNERKPNQMLPWAVVNEVRTSLSAIRFLLFPIENQQHDAQNLKRATDELSRLEQMFKDLEK